MEAVKVGLEVAKGVLAAANAIIDGPGYAAAQASVSAYAEGVESAKSAADHSMGLANGALESTITTQNTLVKTAQDALTLVVNSGIEQQLVKTAQKALQIS